MKLLVPSKRTLIIISLSAIALLSFLITLLFLLAKESPKTKNPESTKTSDIFLDTSQFILPQFVEVSQKKSYYFSRPRERKWNDKEVTRYWFPVRKAIGNSLKNKINEEIGKIFSRIKD